MLNPTKKQKMVSKTRSILILIMFLLFFQLTLAEETDCLYLFQGIACSGCLETEKYIDTLKETYPSIQINKFEVYRNLKNAALLEKYYQNYDVKEESRGLPVVFLAGSYFIGKEPIRNLVEERIKDNTNINCPSLEAEEVVGVVGKSAPYRVLDTFNGKMITTEGLDDSVKKSLLALMLLVLILLIKAKSKEEFLQKGVLSLIGAYLAFFLAGIGIFQWFHPLSGTIFTKVIALTAVGYVLVSIQGFFKTWETFFGEIPEKTLDLLESLFRFINSKLGTFSISFLAAFFTLSEGGEMLKTFQGLILEGTYRHMALAPYLYYSIITLLPLMLLILILFFFKQKMVQKAKINGKSDPEKVKKWSLHYEKIFNFVINLVLFMSGIFFLFS